MNKISIVVPCYNEEAALPFFYQSICQVMEQLSRAEFEIIFVDDGSRDQTLSLVKAFRKQDDRIHYISFSRNFGKEAGLYAGLEASTGDFVAVMDADMQDPPSLLPSMLREILNAQCDCVATRRVDRAGEPPIRSFFAKAFYRIINKISKTEIVDGARDFRLMTREMVDAILSMKEYNRFSKGIFGWVGFTTKWFEYTNIERVAGETKWSFGKLFIYSLEGIVAFSTAPLAVASVTGFVFCILALVLGTFYIIKTLLFGDPVAGFPTLICTVLFVGGCQLFCTGILGQYLAKTYLETKNRPMYIIREASRSKNIEDKKSPNSGLENG